MFRVWGLGFEVLQGFRARPEKAFHQGSTSLFIKASFYRVLEGFYKGTVFSILGCFRILEFSGVRAYPVEKFRF